MLVLLNMIVEPSNLTKRNKGTTIYDKRTVKCDIGTAQYVMEPSNVKKK